MTSDSDERVSEVCNKLIGCSVLESLFYNLCLPTSSLLTTLNDSWLYFKPFQPDLNTDALFYKISRCTAPNK